MIVFLFLSIPIFLIMFIDFIIMKSPSSYWQERNKGTTNWIVITGRYGVPFLVCVVLFPILQLIKDLFTPSYKPLANLINLVVSEHLIPLLVALCISLFLYQFIRREGVTFSSIDFLHLLVTLGGFFTA